MNKAVIYISGTTNETVNNMIVEVLERYCEKHEYEIVALLGENSQAGMSMPMKYSFIGMAEVEDIDAVVTLSSAMVGTADKEVMETIELLAHFGITVKTAKEDMDEYYDALDCEENCGCEECNVDDSEIIRELDRIFRSGIISQQVYPLSGVVTCGDCGVPMVRKTSKVGGKTYAYYLCATHKENKTCESHRISTDKLEEVVLELLQTHIDNIVDLKRILSFIGNVPFQQLDMKKLEERREKKQAEVDRCAELRGMLYEDMKDGIISKEDYKELHAAYEQRKKNAEISIHQIELEMDDVLNRKSKGFVWLDYFTEHQNIEKLTREVVVSLIREIKVFDKNHIEVIFDFDDCYKECLDVIESQGHFVEVDSMGKLNIRLKEAV